MGPNANIKVKMTDKFQYSSSKIITVNVSYLILS